MRLKERISDLRRAARVGDKEAKKRLDRLKEFDLQKSRRATSLGRLLGARIRFENRGGNGLIAE